MAIPFKIIELDRPYKLRFGMETTLEFEEMTGKTIADLDEGNFDITAILKGLWIMMRRENENLTLKDVSRLVDEHAPSMGYVVKITVEAMKASYRFDDPNAPKPNKESE